MRKAIHRPQLTLHQQARATSEPRRRPKTGVRNANSAPANPNGTSHPCKTNRPTTSVPRCMTARPHRKPRSTPASRKLSLTLSFDGADYAQNIATSSEDEDGGPPAPPSTSAESTADTAIDSEVDEDGKIKDPGATAADLSAFSNSQDSDRIQIAKLLKYAQRGNPTATVLALASLRDVGLTDEFRQMTVLEMGGVEILLNILETDDSKCKIASLQVLRDVAELQDVRKAIYDLNGINTLVELLYDMNSKLRSLAAEVIAKAALERHCRIAFRKANAIPRLVDIMDVDEIELRELKEDQLLPPILFEVRAAADAILSLCRSRSNRYYILKAGGILVIAKVMTTRNFHLMLPTIGILQECAVEEEYVIAMRTLNMFEPIVKLLMTHSSPPALKERCARAIGKCSQEPISRDTLRESGAIDALVKLLKTAHHNPTLLSAVTAAIWQCSSSQGNVEKIEYLGGVEALVRLVDPSTDTEEADDMPSQYPPDVVCAAVGALAECASRGGHQARARKALRSGGGLAALLRLLSSTSPPLLVNSAKAIGACSQDSLALEIITEMDGIRLLWSLLKHRDPAVQASAAWSICHCLQRLESSGELVRSFVGGLELLVTLVQSENLDVVASICATIAVIAEDRENLAVLTDHGVVPILAKLARAGNGDDCLRESLARAIAKCADYKKNQAEFGEHRAVTPLVAYFQTSRSPAVHTATTQALEQLSKDPSNCVTMHQHGVVKYLLRLCGSFESDVQVSAANCLRNIRKVALVLEKKPSNASSNPNHQSSPMIQIDG